MLSEYDKANVAQILSGEGDWFTAKLMRLIASADTFNRQKLFKVYPEVVVCVSNFQGISIQTQTPYNGNYVWDCMDKESKEEGRRKFSNPSYGMMPNPSSLQEWKDIR